VPSVKPKRRYTVTAKVLAANRRNLDKANAVPERDSLPPHPPNAKLPVARTC
jgi:hypothetical protein